MLRSSNDLDSDQGFPLRVTQRPDGRYQAVSPSVTSVPPTVASTSHLAAAQHSDKLRVLVRQGKIR